MKKILIFIVWILCQGFIISCQPHPIINKQTAPEQQQQKQVVVQQAPPQVITVEVPVLETVVVDPTEVPVVETDVVDPTDVPQTNDYQPQPVNSVDYDTINLRNSSTYLVYAAIRYLDLNGNWQSSGWYNLQPGDVKTVAYTRNSIYYVYAQTNYATRLWQGKDKYYSINGSQKLYGFRKIVINMKGWGTWTYTFYN
jgi:hypothetical protein